MQTLDVREKQSLIQLHKRGIGSVALSNIESEVSEDIELQEITAWPRIIDFTDIDNAERFTCTRTHSAASARVRRYG